MVRRPWAAAMGLLACVLLLHLVLPGLAPDGRAAVATPAAVDVPETGGTPAAEAEGAGQPCPCEEEPSVRQMAARAPRAAGAGGASAVVTWVPVADRGVTGIRATATRQRPGTVGPAPSTPELQTFRC